MNFSNSFVNFAWNLAHFKNYREIAHFFPWIRLVRRPESPVRRGQWMLWMILPPWNTSPFLWDLRVFWITSFSLPFTELAELWPGWLTIVLQCFYIVAVLLWCLLRSSSAKDTLQLRVRKIIRRIKTVKQQVCMWLDIKLTFEAVRGCQLANACWKTVPCSRTRDWKGLWSELLIWSCDL